MFLIEAGSALVDAVTFGLCFLATTWLLSLKRSSEKFSRAEIFGLIFLSVMLAFAKSVYGTILLLYFLIPRERGGSSVKFFALGAVLLLLNVFTSLAWMEISSAAGAAPATSSQYLGVDVDIAARKNFLVEHPLEFFGMVIDTIGVGAIYYLISSIGVLGVNGDIFLPVPFYLTYIFWLTVVTLHGELKLTFRERVVMFGGFALTTLTFFVFEYLIWAKSGSEYIQGVQGRYFIPLAPMFLCALNCRPPLRHKNLIAAVVGIFSGIATLWTLFDTFY